jgi:hypothetical protein
MYRSQKDFKNKRKYIIESIGWFGVVTILAAYALLSFSVVQSKSYVYIWLNIFGSLALVVQSYVKKDYEPVVLNFVWILLSVVAILHVL